jgi:hypothetical protein
MISKRLKQFHRPGVGAPIAVVNTGRDPLGFQLGLVEVRETFLHSLMTVKSSCPRVTDR